MFVITVVMRLHNLIHIQELHLYCLGHMSDPENLPGLAHFCEHMLFLGTEKVLDNAGSDVIVYV